MPSAQQRNDGSRRDADSYANDDDNNNNDSDDDDNNSNTEWEATHHLPNSLIWESILGSLNTSKPTGWFSLRRSTPFLAGH